VRRLAVIVLCALLAGAVVACGSGSPAPATATATSTSTVAVHLSPYAAARAHVCRAAARNAIASAASVGDHALTTRRTRANTGAIECVFRTHVHGRPLVVSVSVDGSPQPFAVMERAGEEESQIWGAQRFTPAPVYLHHLGIGAWWFPAQQHLLTTDAVNLITATIVRWPGASLRRRRRLAIAAARTYLGPSQPKLARGPAP
jgi:hypothetical protein